MPLKHRINGDPSTVNLVDEVALRPSDEITAEDVV
jgi:hypothetical protein